MKSQEESGQRNEAQRKRVKTHVSLRSQNFVLLAKHRMPPLPLLPTSLPLWAMVDRETAQWVGRNLQDIR